MVSDAHYFSSSYKTYNYCNIKNLKKNIKIKFSSLCKKIKIKVFFFLLSFLKDFPFVKLKEKHNKHCRLLHQKKRSEKMRAFSSSSFYYNKYFYACFVLLFLSLAFRFFRIFFTLFCFMFYVFFIQNLSFFFIFFHYYIL